MKKYIEPRISINKFYDDIVVSSSVPAALDEWKTSTEAGNNLPTETREANFNNVLSFDFN